MSERIALLTDSACDLPDEILKKHSIHVLPLKIIYGTREYNDRVDISADEVYGRMPEQIPTTSMPGPADIHAMFSRLREQGFTKVVAMHLSSGLSGTANAVRNLAQEIKDLQIEVFDSRTLSIGLGFQVYEAARDIARGLDFHKVLENIKSRQPQFKVYYVLETLEYLKRGGRIGKVAAALGEFLHLKPIISVDPEGNYFTFCKARGRRNSIEKLAGLVEEAVSKSTINLAVMHGGAMEEATRLYQRLQNLPNLQEVVFGQISPVLGVHTGPGLVGVAFYEA